MTQAPNVYHQVFIVLRRITHALSRNSTHLKKHHGLTVPQLILCLHFVRLKVVSAGNLAKRVRLSNGTVTGILDRLETRGLVQRTRSTEDRRRVLVKITEAQNEKTRTTRHGGPFCYGVCQTPEMGTNPNSFVASKDGFHDGV